jgi:hypothetical protein
MGSDLLTAYRIIKQQKAREKDLKRFMGKNPDYLLIKALVAEARTDVVATIVFPNGTKLDIKRADAMDRMQAIMSTEQAGSY